MAPKPAPAGRPPRPALGSDSTRTHSGVGSTLAQDRTGSSSLPPTHADPVSSVACQQAKGVPAVEAWDPAPRGATLPADDSAAVLLFPDREDGPAHPATSAGHFQYEVGENLTPRFKIMRRLGEGTFGQVLECWDRRRGDYVALKVIRCVPKYRDAAMVELRVLATIAAHDPAAQWHCVRLQHWFEYRGHVCMAFERLGPSLYDYLRRNDYAPFPLDMVRDVTRQLLEAVSFLHSLGLVHTDLKPENVLQRGQEVARASWPAGSRLARRLPATPALALVDFGSAAWDADPHAAVVSTRHYRAPEVVLGAGWGPAADLWSLGCLAVELLTGDALFATHEDAEHLAMMGVALGPMPAQLAARVKAPGVSRLFVNNELDWPAVASSKKSARAVARTRPLHVLLAARADPGILPHLDVVLDLLRGMLAYLPSERGTAAQLLTHPFFTLRL